MRRRKFIAGLAGAAAWPLASWAQQGDRVARIGFPVLHDHDDPLEQVRLAWFKQSLQALGWMLWNALPPLKRRGFVKWCG